MITSSGLIIPVSNTPKKITLHCGATALVRKAERSMRNKLLTAAEVREGDLASLARLSELASKWGVVAIEGELKHASSGAVVKFERRATPSLGSTASEEVFNALHDDDVAAIVGEVMSGGVDAGVLTEDQRGNS